MRRYTDPAGRVWDVVVGRESWGALYALFIPAAGNEADIRQTLLSAESTEAAHAELAGLTEPELGRLLERSEPKP